MMAECLSRLVVSIGNAEVSAHAHDAAEALALSQKLAPDVAIVDLELSPDCSLVSALHGQCPDARIVVLADRSKDDATGLVRALAAGATGAIYKDDSLEDLARALSVSSKTHPVVANDAAGVLLQSYVDAMADKRARILATIEALAEAVEVRDAVTGDHLQRVAHLAKACLERIDPDLAKNEEVDFGFLLHDVGKIGIPDAILNKRGRLSDEEWTVMRRHPELGVRIVEPIGFSPATTDIILSHHERWDGNGYPKGLANEDIPLTARAFAVADAYDAMTSDRPYRSALRHEEALEEVTAASGQAFDPDVVEVFLDVAA